MAISKFPSPAQKHNPKLQSSISDSSLTIFSKMSDRQIKLISTIKASYSYQQRPSHPSQILGGILGYSFCLFHHVQYVRRAFWFYHGNKARVCPFLIFQVQRLIPIMVILCFKVAFLFCLVFYCWLRTDLLFLPFICPIPSIHNTAPHSFF